MSYDVHSIFAKSYVQAGSGVIDSDTGTDIILATGDGAKFGNPQNLTIWPIGVQPTLANSEVVRVTGINTDTLTVERAQEGTTALSNIAAGYQVANTETPKIFTDIETVLDTKENSADLAAVAESGAYSDLTGTPTVPSSLADLTGTSDDVTEGATHLFLTGGERTKLSDTSGINTGDQDLSGLVPKTTTVNGHALSSDVTVTADDVLPTQTGNAGNYLTTDGSNTSWAAVAGGGQTLYTAVVAASGGDYTTVSDAITAGETSIFVRDGTYTEGGIASNATNNISITGESAAGVVLNFSTNNFQLSGTNISIKHVTLKTSTGTTTLDSNNPYMEDVIVASSNATNPALVVSGSFSIVKGIQLVDTATTGLATYRLYFGALATISDSNFWVHRNGQLACVYVGGSYSTIRGCTFYQSGAQGGAFLLTLSGVSSTAIGNIFTNCGGTDGVINLAGLGCSAVGNTLDGGAPGIAIDNATQYCAVTSNIWYIGSSGSTAIDVGGSGSTVTGNTIYHRSQTGASALGIVLRTGKSNITITGNTVTNSTVALTIASGDSNIVVSGNNFGNNGTSISDGGTGTISTGNYAP